MTHPPSDVLANPSGWDDTTADHVEHCAACRATARLLGGYRPTRRRAHRLGPIELVRPLAQGGMGEVWMGKVAPSGVPVAVKVVRPDRLSPAARHLFEQEIAVLAVLDHPNVLRVLDCGTVPPGLPLPEGSAWMAMEYLSGGTLSRLSIDTWPVLERVIRELLRGLAHAHGRGVVHRDIKPANVLVGAPEDSRPGVKLCDFGLASTASAGGPSGGTLAFMAPEQLRGASPGPWVDLYAVGVLAWVLTCRRSPLVSESVDDAVAQKRLGLPPLQPALSVPEGWGAWVRRLTEPSPDRRPLSCAEALAQMEALGPPLDVAATGPRRPLAAAPTWQTLLAEPSGAAQVHRGGHDSRRVRWHLPDRASGVQGADPQQLRGGGLGLLRQRRPRLRFRHEERAELWAWMQGPAGHRVLTGPPGVGVSALARWLHDDAREAGAEGAWVADPGAWRADLREAARHWRRGATVDTLADAMAATVAERPLLLVVEGTAPEELVALCAAAGAHLLALRSDAPAPGLELTPLPEEEVVDLLRDRATLAPPLAASLARYCAGRPGIAMDRLLRAAGPTGEGLTWSPRGWASTQRGDVEPVVLDDASAVALSVAAELGPEVPRSLWHALSPPTASARAVVASWEAHRRVVSTEQALFFVDEGLHRAVLAHYPAPSTMHRRALAVLEESPGGDVGWRRAQHLFRLGRWADGFAALRAAAHDQRDRGGTRSALVGLQRVPPWLAPAPRWERAAMLAALWVIQAAFLRLAGDMDAATGRLRRVLDDPELDGFRVTRGYAWLERCRQLQNGTGEEAGQALDRAEACLGGVASDDPEAVLVHQDPEELRIYIAYNRANIASRVGPDLERALLLPLPDRARDAGFVALEADTSSALAMTLLSDDPAAAVRYSERAVAANRRIDRRSGLADSLSTLGHALLAVGRVEDAVGSYGEAQRMYEVQRSSFRIYPLMGRARALLRLGRADEALDVMESGLPLAAEHGDLVLCCALLVAAGCYWCSDDRERAEAAIAAGCALGDPPWETRLLREDLLEGWPEPTAEAFWRAADPLVAPAT